MNKIDHPIFTQSIDYIRSRIQCPGLDNLETEVLERIIHSTGDFSIQHDLQFSPNSCSIGVSALKAGAPILTDTFMAAAAVAPMAKRTLGTAVHCVLDWHSSCDAVNNMTRTAIGLKRAWQDFSSRSSEIKAPIVLIGSAPQALEVLLELVTQGLLTPSLIIGMPVGFIRVIESKTVLSNYDVPQIRIDGNRGGAGMAAATINALLRASFYKNK